MTDREFADVLRVKALELLTKHSKRLALHAENSAGSMAAHVARDEVIRLRQLADHLNALAAVAETIR